MSPTMRVYVATNLSSSLWPAGDMLTSSRGCGPATHVATAPSRSDEGLSSSRRREFSPVLLNEPSVNGFPACCSRMYAGLPDSGARGWRHSIAVPGRPEIRARTRSSDLGDRRMRDHHRTVSSVPVAADSQAFGLMFWLTRNRLSGSYLALIAASRL